MCTRHITLQINHPYSVIGATFNDTNRTITISGTTALSGLTTDVTITTPVNGNLLMYDSSSSKWINASSTAGSSTLSGCTGVSVSSPSNDQILVFTTASSLNKWTAYTISGATFNDTNKTITFSGTTSLSGLTTDVNITTPVNGNLIY